MYANWREQDDKHRLRECIRGENQRPPGRNKALERDQKCKIVFLFPLKCHLSRIIGSIITLWIERVLQVRRNLI